MPVVPFRVFSRVARRAELSPHGVLSEFAARSEFLARRSTAVIGFAIPLCRWPFPRLCGFPSPGRAGHVKQPVHPLFGFRVPPESCPTRPSPAAAAARHLSWASAPYSTLRLGDPLAAGVAGARYGPPSGFGYPLGGLRPPSPCRFCFTPAALLGFALRSVLLPEGTRRVSGADEPTYRFSRRCSRRRGDGPAQRAAVPGLSPFRQSLATGGSISAPATGGSLGLHPSRACRRKPDPSLHPDSSHALLRYPPRGEHPPAPRSINRPPLGPTCAAQRAERPAEQPF